jgi:hypothetical protein
MGVMYAAMPIGCNQMTTPPTPVFAASQPAKQSAARHPDQTIELSYQSHIGQPVLTDSKLGGVIVTLPDPPKDVRDVRAIVDYVELPMFNSPSIAGERAAVTFSVERGSVPAYPECVQIRLTFDPYANPFVKGKHFTFQFHPNGDFWGIRELPHY